MRRATSSPGLDTTSDGSEARTSTARGRTRTPFPRRARHEPLPRHRGPLVALMLRDDAGDRGGRIVGIEILLTRSKRSSACVGHRVWPNPTQPALLPAPAILRVPRATKT